MDIAIGFVLGIVATFLIFVFIGIGMTGSVGRSLWGLAVASRGGRDEAFLKKVNDLMGKPAPSTDAPAKPSGEPLIFLGLLQSEARLIDFLMEDIAEAGDEQVGAAVREIHAKAKAVIGEHLKLEAVLDGNENETVIVPAGFDPSTIRVVGNVTGEPPFRGELQHPGWKVTEIKLPKQPDGQDPLVLQPAEVHVP